MKQIMINIGNVDFQLLQEQKLWLLHVMDLLAEDNKPIEAGDGLVNFLDYIQDQAAEQIGEDAVFGVLSENEY